MEGAVRVVVAVLVEVMAAGDEVPGVAEAGETGVIAAAEAAAMGVIAAVAVAAAEETGEIAAEEGETAAG